VNSSASASQIVEVSLAEVGLDGESMMAANRSIVSWDLQRADAECKIKSGQPYEEFDTLDRCALWAANDRDCSPWITYAAKWRMCICVAKGDTCQMVSTVEFGYGVYSVYTVRIGSSSPSPPTPPPTGDLPRDIFNDWMQFGEGHHIAQGGYACGYKGGWCGCSCGHNLGANVDCTLPYIGPGVEGGHTCGSYGNLYGCAEAHYLSSYCPKSSR